MSHPSMNFLTMILVIVSLGLIDCGLAQVKSDGILGQETYQLLSNIIKTGSHLGLQECQKQFKNEIWNCSLHYKNVHKQLPIFLKRTLPYATRETAYVHAISAAAITHRITTECKKGKIPGCTCAIIKKTHKPDDDWQWGGCSDNIKYGEKMTKRFIDKLENGNDARAAFNLHNNEAGRRILRSNTKRECKCHGVTGSCTLKTCWKELGAFDEVGSMLKENYNDAAKVSYMDKELKENINRQLRAISNKDKRLVYLEASPNYCLRNDTVGSPGMLGRTCRSDEASTSKCRGLCETCRLKHKTVEQSKQIKCKCKFIWCCSVQCETCTSQYSLTTCAR